MARVVFIYIKLFEAEVAFFNLFRLFIHRIIAGFFIVYFFTVNSNTPILTIYCIIMIELVYETIDPRKIYPFIKNLT